MNEIEKYSEKIFEDIKHIDEYGNEYWEARELMKVLEYKSWDKFKKVLQKAKIACEKSGNKVEDHFSQVGKMVKLGSGAVRRIEEYLLTRYACYLIVQNGNPKKKVIALGQAYFAVQTRRQEISEKDYSKLS